MSDAVKRLRHDAENGEWCDSGWDDALAVLAENASLRIRLEKAMDELGRVGKAAAIAIRDAESLAEARAVLEAQRNLKNGEARSKAERHLRVAQTALEASEARAEALREALEAVQWGAESVVEKSMCFLCERLESEGHAESCLVAAALAGRGGEIKKVKGEKHE